MNYLRLSPFSFFLFIIFFSLRFRPTFNLNLTRLACERNSRDADPTVRSTEEKRPRGHVASHDTDDEETGPGGRGDVVFPRVSGAMTNGRFINNTFSNKRFVASETNRHGGGKKEFRFAACLNSS